MTVSRNMYAETAIHGPIPGFGSSVGSMPVQPVPWPTLDISHDAATSAEQFWSSWSWSGADAIPGVMCTSPSSTQRKDSISELPSPGAAPNAGSLVGSSDSSSTSPPAEVEAKKERRRTQNRLAQQAFRERKVQRFRDFQGEIENLNSTISRLECEKSDLQTSLRDARTEIEILRSMLPQITRVVRDDQTQMNSADADHQLQTLLLKLGLNGILRGIASNNGNVQEK